MVVVVNSFFEDGQRSREVSCTDVVLVPKQTGLERVTRFRLISLCNFIYKIISRVMVNRMKHFLRDLITKNRSAFVARRQIHDNIMVAQEMFCEAHPCIIQSGCWLALTIPGIITLGLDHRPFESNMATMLLELS